MTRRSLIIPLHWAVAFLVLVMTEGGSGAPSVRWAFVGLAVLWLALMVAGGPLARPGPKLQGAARALFRPFHLLLYAALAAAAALNALSLWGRASEAAAFRAVLILLALASFHAVFHLWRHTALRDGALRAITPRGLHRHL